MRQWSLQFVMILTVRYGIQKPRPAVTERIYYRNTSVAIKIASNNMKIISFAAETRPEVVTETKSEVAFACYVENQMGKRIFTD